MGRRSVALNGTNHHVRWWRKTHGKDVRSWSDTADCLTYRGATAPVQVREDEPLFCVKFIPVPPGIPYAPSTRDIAIARFDEKKDHRELQVKAGVGKDRLPDLTVLKWLRSRIPTGVSPRRNAFRSLIKDSAKGDHALAWASRRFVYVRLSHDERSRSYSEKIAQVK